MNSIEALEKYLSHPKKLLKFQVNISSQESEIMRSL